MIVELVRISSADKASLREWRNDPAVSKWMYTNHEIGEEIVGRIRGLKPHLQDVTLTIEGGINRPGYEKTPEIAALYEHAKGLAAEIGFDLIDLKTGGGSDGNYTASIAPTLDGMGVDGDGAHTHEERLYISSVLPRTRLLMRLMETLQ